MSLDNRLVKFVVVVRYPAGGKTGKAHRWLDGLGRYLVPGVTAVAELSYQAVIALEMCYPGQPVETVIAVGGPALGPRQAGYKLEMAFLASHTVRDNRNFFTFSDALCSSFSMRRL